MAPVCLTAARFGKQNYPIARTDPYPRFFSDQCVPAEITDTLRRHGHQVTLLREVLPMRSLDPVVIAKAQELGAVLVSLNGDLADIVAYPPASYLGIVAV